MGGFAAVLDRRGSAARDEDLAAVIDPVRHRGPDGVSQWRSGPAAIARLRHATTPEGDEGVVVEGPAAIAFDGRIDNRDELLPLLDADARTDATDAALVLAAYRRWGSDAAARLIGDFAFVIWDGDRIFAARDPFGVRPFCFHASSRLFVAGSELRQVLAHPAVSGAINEGMVGEYLACDITSRHETLYRDVDRLAPGTCLEVSLRGFRIWPYWTGEGIEELRLPGDADYAERFRQTLREAVRCRLRSRTAVAFEVSGGLDSSSVCCMAADLAATESGVPALQTFSLAFPGLDCDETHYSRLVAERWELPWHPVQVEPLPRVDALERAAMFADFPGHANGFMGLALLSEVQQKGLSVNVTGIGGDEWYVGPPSERPTPRAAASRAATRLLPSALTVELRASARRRWLPSWLEPRFVRRIRLGHRLSQRARLDPGWPRSRRWLWARGTAGWNVHALECEEREAARHGIEKRHPLLDRRLVELSLALPERQLQRGPWTKLVLREAMRGLLPEPIRTRQSKASFGHVFRRALRDAGASARFDALAMGNTGWIDAGRARAALRRFESKEPGGDESSLGWPLWMLYGLDAWYAKPSEKKKR